MVFMIKKVIGMLPCKKPCMLKRMENATKTPNMAKKYACEPLLAHRFEFSIFMSNNKTL
jgi:hypothetical protein